MASKKEKTLNTIQRQTLSMTATKEVILHQFLQTIMFGSEGHGLLWFIEGVPGIGKTALMKQVLDDMVKDLVGDLKKTLQNTPDYQYFVKEQNSKGDLHTINLSAKTSCDFSGLPYMQKKGEKTIQKFAQPDNLPMNGYGIIFYDEANRVFDLEMKSTLLSLWMDRGVNGHFLGEGFIQIAAGNNFDDERFETEMPDQALKERFRVIRLQPTIAEVISFLEKKHQNHFLVNYLKENPDLCNIASKDYDSAYSPRTIDMAMKITRLYKDEIPDEKENLVKNILTAYFSSADATRIINATKDNKEITFAQVVENPNLAKKIKRSDMPTTTKIMNEVFERIKSNVKKKKPLTDKEKEAMTSIRPQMNFEAITTSFLDKMVNLDQAKDGIVCGEFNEYMKVNHPKFYKSLDDVTEKVFKS